MTEAETETLMRSGVAHHVEGRLGEAQSVYLEVLQRQPEHAGALHLLGLIAFQSGEADKAVDLFDHAIAVRPDFPEAYDNRGTALYALGRYEDAVASYDRSIALKPGQAGPHANRGNALQTLHRGEEALTAFDTAIALDPEFADGFNNRAVTLMQLDRAQEALGSADEALRIMPGFAAAHTHRGNALHALGRLEEALVSHEAALRLHPDYAEAWCNRALALSDLGRHEAAAADHARAVALKPDFAIARFNLGIELLQLGRLEDGWDGYEWRGLAEAGMAPRTYPQPRWTGQEVRDRTVLVYHEQGLGDSIQFCRYAAMLAGRGARVVLAAPASLHPVLWTLEPRVRVIGQNDDPGPFDFYCPMASLPQSFGTRLDSIPAPARYLAADETSRAQWAVALGEKVRPRIGVVWGGSRLLKNDGRSILFDQFRSLISDVLVPGGPTGSACRTSYGRPTLKPPRTVRACAMSGIS